MPPELFNIKSHERTEVFCGAIDRSTELLEGQVEGVVGLVEPTVSNQRLTHPPDRLTEDSNDALLDIEVVVLHRANVVVNAAQCTVESLKAFRVGSQRAPDPPGGVESFAPGAGFEAVEFVEILLGVRGD